MEGRHSLVPLLQQKWEGGWGALTEECLFLALILCPRRAQSSWLPSALVLVPQASLSALHVCSQATSMRPWLRPKPRALP